MADEVLAPAESKAPWQSKTILISVVVGLCSALMPLIPALSKISAFVNSNGLLIGGIWSVLAIVLRAVSKDSIVLRD